MTPASDSVSGHEHWMALALAQARLAEAQDEVPVGAVLVRDGVLLAAAHNHPIGRHDPTAHAEILALRAAATALGNYRLPNTTLYVTLEPCLMCVGALLHARIGTLVFGAREPRAGSVVSQVSLESLDHVNHRIAVIEGVLKDQCGMILTTFFHRRRRNS